MHRTIKLKTVNSEIIKPIKETGPQDTRPILGGQLFSEIYSNIGLIARKKSGKTTALAHILKRCAGRDTTVIFFCSTIFKDKNYVGIRKMLEKRGINFEVHTSLKEDGIDQLDELVHDLTEEAKEREMNKSDSEKHEPQYTTEDLLNQLSQRDGATKYLENDDEEVEEKKTKKSKYQMPEYIIVLDDLSNQMKASSLETLLKKNRHFLCKIILSTQYIHDIAPESLVQLDYWLVYKGQPKAKLEKIYKDADINIDFDVFCFIYKDATKEKYSFLYIDKANVEFRKNFRQQYIIPDFEENNLF